MQVQEPREARTHIEDGMKIIECVYPLPKGRFVHSSATHQKIRSDSLYSSHPSTHRSLSSSWSQLSTVVTNVDENMTIIITSALRRWLTNCDLEGFIKVAEAPAWTWRAN